MSIAILDVQDGRLVLAAPPRLKELIASIPGMSFKGMDSSGVGLWSADLSWATAVATRGVLGDGLDVTLSTQAWAASIRESLALANAIKGRVWGYASDARLFDFQRTGVDYLTFRERVLLADEMGTGKTVQSAMALAQLGFLSGSLMESRPSPFPALVVCTNSMKAKWAKELMKWAGVRSAVVGEDKKNRLKAIAQVQAGEADVLVIHWDALRLHSRLAKYGSIALSEDERTPKELNAIQWRTVIADEAHKAKDPHSKQTRALWALGDGAEYRWALTGTPVTGAVEDLWTILRFVAPAEFPSKSRFIDRYAISGMNPYGGFQTYGLNPKNEAEFRALTQPFILRRTKAEVLPDLPPKIVSHRHVQMGTKQAAAYKRMEKEQMYVDDDGNLLFATDPLTRNQRLNQFSAATPVLEEVEITDPETGEPRKVLKVVELIEPSCKVDAIMDMLDESDEPIVIGAESRKLLELLARKLDKAKPRIPYGMITGAQSPGEREMAVSAFQAGELRAVLVTLGAGAEGITLTRARRLVFMQASYEFVKNAQFEDRIHRIGQDADNVEIVYLLTEGTVDVDRPEVSEEKRQLAEDVLRVQ